MTTPLLRAFARSIKDHVETTPPLELLRPAWHFYKQMAVIGVVAMVVLLLYGAIIR